MAPSAAVLAALLFLLSGCMTAVNPPTKAIAFPQDYPEILLSSHLAPEVVVEVDVYSAYPPSTLALDELRSTLEFVARKTSVDTEMQLHEPLAGNHTAESLLRLHLTSFDRPSSQAGFFEGQATVHVLYVDGTLDGTAAKGFFFHGATGVIVIFPETLVLGTQLTYQPGPEALIGLREKQERASLVHELGHAFGLVGCGIPMLVERQTDGCHSTNSRSVMYSGNYEVAQAPDFVQDQLIDPYWEFDPQDLQDIRQAQAGFRSS